MRGESCIARRKGANPAPPRSPGGHRTRSSQRYTNRGGDMRRPLLSPPGMVLALLCAMYFLLFVNRTNIAIAGPLIRSDLNLSNTELGLAFSAFAYPYALFQLFGGMIGDRFGPRATLAVSALLVCIATVWTGAAGGLASLLSARLALGLREGGPLPATAPALAGPDARRGLVLVRGHN